MALISGLKRVRARRINGLTTMAHISSLKLVEVKFYARMLKGRHCGRLRCKLDDSTSFLDKAALAA
jgi:hypothetical protein